MAEPLSLTDVRCRYTVRRDPRDGRDFIIDSDGQWTKDTFAVGFHDCVVWHYTALAMAGPETTWQELKRDGNVPSEVLSLDEIRRFFTVQVNPAADRRPYVTFTQDRSYWSDDTVAVTIFEAIEASVPMKKAQEPCKHHSHAMWNGLPWETDAMIGYQLTRRGTNWVTPTEQIVRGWFVKLFCNTKPSQNCRGEYFEETILGSVDDLEWAHMHTHNARFMGIMCQCRHCGAIMRIAWNGSSTLRHMQECRAAVCGFLGIPYEMPNADDSDQDLIFV